MTGSDPHSSSGPPLPRVHWRVGPQRYRFLDLYRGFIVLMMLEGHVLRALLTADAQRSSLFVLHELAHGITGPGFLFGAGFAFAIATQRRWEYLLFLTPAFFRRAGRVLLLVIIGYALHIPFLSLTKMLEQAMPQQWTVFFSFDVLQCIGVTLLGLRLLLLVLRSETSFIRSVVLILLAVVYATPFFWSQDLDHTVPRFVSMALNGLGASPFPLFPYSGFLLAGAAVAWDFLRHAQQGTENRFVRNLAILGLILVVAGYFLDWLPFQTYRSYNFWFTSPNYFWMRLGILCLLLSGLWFFESLVVHREDSDVWMPKWLIILGVESFAVYILHLVVLYGWVTNPQQNMAAWWGLRLPLGPTLVALSGFTLVMVLISQLWHYVKKQHPILMKGVYWYLGLTVGYYFFTSPY